MNALVLLAGVLAVPQAHGPSARELLNNPRPLTGPEIATVLSRSQEALVGKVFSLPWTGRYDGGLDILMGSAGQPRIIRSAGEIEGGIVGGVVRADGTSHDTSTRWRGPYIRITEFTGRPAVRCGESAAAGELVIEYEKSPPATQWETSSGERFWLGFEFKYGGRPPRPPAGVSAPDCIQRPSVNGPRTTDMGARGGTEVPPYNRSGIPARTASTAARTGKSPAGASLLAIWQLAAGSWELGAGSWQLFSARSADYVRGPADP